MAVRGRQEAEDARLKGEALEAAARLADYFRAGGQPQVVRSSVLLAAGEVCFGEGDAVVWQYTQVDGVTYRHEKVIGSLSGGLAVAVGNRARRRQAEEYAALQWRRVGLVRLVVTSRRVLCMERGQWGTFFWYSNVRQVHPDLTQMRTVFALDGVPMSALEGPFVPWLTVLLVRLLYGEIVDVIGRPGLPPGGW